MGQAVSSVFSTTPFDQHRLIDTGDLEEARLRTSLVLDPHRLRLTSPGQKIRNQLDVLSCGRLSLLRLTWGAGVSVDPDGLSDYYLLVLPVKGQASFYFDGATLDVTPRTAFIISPGRRFHFTAGEDYEQVLLRLDAQAVHDAWCRLTGHDQAPPICFEAVMPAHAVGWQALAPMLQWVSRCAGQGASQLAGYAALLAQTEILVATTLLLHQPHNMAPHLWPAPPPRAPSAVRMAQTYLLDNLGEDLPVARVAAHCGLSVRRLQALFRDECGQSPLQWLRQQRLEAVRQSLLLQGRRAKVGETAMRFGFSHLGDFSKAYRQAFGETPQQTRDN
ncbi:AraC family transcriptional regulator [Pusillimonas sp. CC-YST705]|uniref:AraC family transcriptional regulator n=1 Tax=Mesopusillimonas faecipullorum TaxID=2755040 RepID=A0ABS8C8Q9_9BURK|nr:AraC family transcriptional regulator [Mesopusillimonas faecipullorum]MCB5362252.1 AraC family transcriptional regulator [Mesopusillimonas faecipullorum]